LVLTAMNSVIFNVGDAARPVANINHPAKSHRNVFMQNPFFQLSENKLLTPGPRK